MKHLLSRLRLKSGIKTNFRWFLNQMELYDLRRNTLLIQNIPRDYHGSTISCQATNIIGSSTVEYSINISCTCFVSINKLNG